MIGPRAGWGWAIFQLGAIFGGLILTAAAVVVAILLVRYLIVATRAAQRYVDSHPAVGTSSPVATEPPPTPAQPSTPATTDSASTAPQEPDPTAGQDG